MCFLAVIIPFAQEYPALKKWCGLAFPCRLQIHLKHGGEKPPIKATSVSLVVFSLKNHRDKNALCNGNMIKGNGSKQLFKGFSWRPTRTSLKDENHFYGILCRHNLNRKWMGWDTVTLETCHRSMRLNNVQTGFGQIDVERIRGRPIHSILLPPSHEIGGGTCFFFLSKKV